MCAESGLRKWRRPQALFVFGDSFVDSGNLPKMKGRFRTSRQWFYPYGVSNEEGPVATGRFSDFMVQSDFIAKMLGLPMSPPTYESTRARYCTPDGMNFAYGGTGVNNLTPAWNNLRDQVDEFKRMLKIGIIMENYVTHSVALIGIDGDDYKRFGIHRNSRDIASFARNMTAEIAENVERLRNLGVKRILVNNMHPLGCTPSLCRKRNYKACDDMANKAASVHNSEMKQKLGKKKGVLIVDLSSAFNNIIGQSNHVLAEDSESYKQFKHTRKPCCETIDPKGFCGQRDENSKPLYSQCRDPQNYFFWDDMHPTHTGWKAVIAQLENPIKKFLGHA
uniref:Uncharacterized protein n=1 Tax=Avena sativa TaxID=4498 RepID=A0ACD5UV86_AVESA